MSLSWSELETFVVQEPDRINGPTNAQAVLRLFGAREKDVRVTLYRDNHAWCPYCQKIWLWLEEKKIPYRVRKVTMFCYGEKESWYKRIVPSGMLPAIELDGELITESDMILVALESTFGPLVFGMVDPQVVPLRRLERHLFSAWCEWLCHAEGEGVDAQQARAQFVQAAGLVESALGLFPGPWFLSEFSTSDVIFVPYLERMSASLYYYKGYNVRLHHPAIDRWFSALERRDTYLGTQSDFHTHSHDLPPQMGRCLPSGGAEQRACAKLIDTGLGLQAAEVIETRADEPPVIDSAREALSRVLKHRAALLRINCEATGYPVEVVDEAFRCALTALLSCSTGTSSSSSYDLPPSIFPGSSDSETRMPPHPPAGSAVCLRYLRDRISVPRDMSLFAARSLRQALERCAALDCISSDGAKRVSPAIEIPKKHRRDQNPRPFA